MGVKRTRSNSELNAKPELKRRAVFGDLTNNFKLPEFYASKNKFALLKSPVSEETSISALPKNKPTLKEKIELIEEEPEIVKLSLALEPVTIGLDRHETTRSKSPEKSDFDFFDNQQAGISVWGSEYAKDIFKYFQSQESVFVVPDYMSTKQTDITSEMRSILVEWMVEVQSNFELHHETLYLAVKLVDKYLSEVCIRRSVLQLVGTASLLIACKYEEHILPQCDDFLYVCDNAYDIERLFEMERKILAAVDFSLGFPLSYRFLRRYSNVSEQKTKTLTLARYILETSLLDYQFSYEKESLKAAACLWLSLKMTDNSWDDRLTYHSGYCETDLIDLAIKLNTTLLNPPLNQNNEIHKKYSHHVFLQVAQIPKLPTEQLKWEQSNLIADIV